MTTNKIVNHEEWLAARISLLKGKGTHKTQG